MSQNFFDTYVNRIGQQAAQMAAVVNPNQFTREEIDNWTED